MACGTPVVAFRNSSIPEVVDQGTTGFIVDTVDDAVHAVHRACSLDRTTCRRVFEERFTAGRMCTDYLEIYNRIRSPSLASVSDNELFPSTSAATGDTQLCQ